MMKRITKSILQRISKALGLSSLATIEDILIYQEHENRRRLHPNPFVMYGMKTFSQTDEDGLTLEIIRRIGIEKGSFIEFGVGDGMENNTLILLASGWKGSWFGGQELRIDPGKGGRLLFNQVWITRENIAGLCEGAREHSGNPDLVSIDLDGNDYHLAEELLRSGINPSVFIIEYNARFIPPIEFVMEYAADHSWAGDDHFGASLASFHKLFRSHGYELVCCNAATGANAFFVKKEFMPLFPEVPTSLEEKYCAPFYFRPKRFSHRQSVRTIEKAIS